MLEFSAYTNFFFCIFYFLIVLFIMVCIIKHNLLYTFNVTSVILLIEFIFVFVFIRKIFYYLPLYAW